MLQVSISSFPARAATDSRQEACFRRDAETTQPQLLMESARQVAERTDALARTVKPGFTDYLCDVSQFRKFERKLLVLAAEAQRE
jgi:hypothetical protein